MAKVISVYNIENNRRAKYDIELINLKKEVGKIKYKRVRQFLG